MAGLELEGEGGGGQVALAVVALAAGRPDGGDQPELLGVPQHPGAGSDLPGGVPYAHARHPSNLYKIMSRLVRPLAGGSI